MRRLRKELARCAQKLLDDGVELAAFADSILQRLRSSSDPGRPANPPLELSKGRPRAEKDREAAPSRIARTFLPELPDVEQF